MHLSIFASGSTGNCALLSLGGRRFLIDAGISARAIRTALAEEGCRPEELDGILITHEHTDHISGLAVFCKHDPLPVYAPGAVASHLRWSLPGVEACLREIRPLEPFSVGGVTLTAFPTPHDAAQSVGYRLEAEGEAFALATDTGCVTEEMLRFLRGAELAVIEANHDEQLLRYGPYPAMLKRRVLSDHGHLSNAACASLARQLADGGVKKLVLGHLSRENNRPELAREAVLPALAGTAAELYIAPAKGRLELEVAPCCV